LPSEVAASLNRIEGRANWGLAIGTAVHACRSLWSGAHASSKAPRADKLAHVMETRARRRRFPGLLAAAVALVMGAAVSAAPAVARPGSAGLGVSFAGCITASASVAAKGSCDLAPPPSNLDQAMNFPSAMALAPDASSLYATGSFTSSVVHYQRKAASGALSFSDCLTGNFGGPCSQIATVHTTTDSGLDLVDAVAVSHDGRFVYTTSGANGGDSTVMSFARDPVTGSLSFRSCVTGSTEMNNANPGVCTMLPGAPSNPTMPSPALERPTGIAISPNDHFVYISLEFGIATFQRDPTSGALSFEGCLTSLAATSPPCVHARTNVVDDPRTPLIAPDGRSLYLADQHGGNVATFNLDPANGGISFHSCITENSRLQPSCTLARTARRHSYGGLDAPTGLALSANGRSLYATSMFGSLEVFKRNTSTGNLTAMACIAAARESPGCTVIPAATRLGGGSGLNGARGTVVSRNGRRLYVAAGADSSLAVFKRHPANGKLSYLGCMTANARFGPQGNGACSKVLRTGSRRGYGSGLYKVSQLLLSPDGRWLYALDVGDDAISRLRVD
jgi:6-phosphogluconolactonase (cycloisomerase 2 family)